MYRVQTYNRSGILIFYDDRREKVLEELLSTEENYVEDLHSVLYGYRDRLDEAGEEVRQRSEDIFGNMEEIFEFHSQVLI